MKTEYAAFSGSVPSNYDKYLGPLFFEPYAVDLVSRIDQNKAHTVLEIACGTGRVTKHLRKALPSSSTLIATDLNAGMIEVAKQNVRPENIEFKEADAQALPFDDNSFDLIVCQFGFMFVPDKPKAFSEAYRVLKPGGTLLFNTWDKLENNKLSYVVRNIVAEHLEASAAEFYKVPFSLTGKEEIESFLKDAKFNKIQIELVTKQGTGVSALEAAKGLITGTPMFKQLIEKGAKAPEQLIAIAEKELSKLFGNGTIKTELNAFVSQALN